MGAIRSSLLLVFVFMGVDKIITKPIFDDFFCDLFCTDDDGSTSTIASANRDGWDDFCNDCVDSSEVNSVNLIIPPSPVGMNFFLQNIDGNWVANLTAIGQQAPTTRPTTGSSASSAATTAAGGTTAAAGTTATTAAPTTAAPTTAAPTTAAPTTAAPGS